MTSKLKFSLEVEQFLKENVSRLKLDDENTNQLFNGLLEKLATPPAFTTLRVNTLQKGKEVIKDQLKHVFNKKIKCEITEHDILPDVLVIPHSGPRQLDKEETKVIVGIQCGMAVLRGAQVFCQGIVGAPIGMEIGTKVSVYADLNGTCCKGLVKPFDGDVMFVGNGIAEISRHNLFCSEQPPSGVGINMTDPVYVAPSLSGVLPSLIFAQNLPSIVCSHILNPQPGETVLDMCAAPGGKTMHIATLMKNQGLVVAFDKSEKKIKKIQENLASWDLTCVQPYSYDGTKACQPSAGREGGPPYPSEMFDRIMLDAPCSALGQRPALRNKASLSEVTSYPPLQRKLFSQAVELLKVSGTLVYSTCTFTVEENEGLVSWALQTFPCIELCKQVPHIGSHGRPGSNLSTEQLMFLQRFFPSKDSLIQPDSDTIGFFIAKFVKCKR